MRHPLRRKTPPRLGRSLKAGLLGAATLLLVQPASIAQEDPFRELDDVLPAPSVYRTASGRPGPAYWQQQADYRIEARLDPDALQLTGSLSLTYTNNSPDTLDMVWFHLDQNRFAPGGHFEAIATTQFPTPRGSKATAQPTLAIEELQRTQLLADRDHGMSVTSLTDGQGKALPFSVNGTMMRVDLTRPLKPGQKAVFRISWTSELVEARPFSARSGYEKLEDGSLIAGAAEWFPRIAAYTDVRGWHVEQYLGSGEFALEFGSYDVAISVPETYVVAATGALSNASDVLTPAQRNRLASAADSDRPLQVVTTAEAAAARLAAPGGYRTWRFRADTVRDFAWAASPAFIWDAMGVAQPGTEAGPVMAMSFYPDEGDPLWGHYATEAIAHALETYSRFTFPYPYPTAQAINGPIASGMEYPMISFNGPRPENQDVNGQRTYSRYMKHRIIGIIIHETGHFYFPMIVNSDERRWVWMDEGLTSFLELISNLTFEDGFDENARTRDGVIPNILARPQRPLMSTPDSALVRRNAYDKTAMALFVLRETILGRETFDRAFRSYANAWKFKRPEPADFFRIMEKEAGQDLDWFWRAWFFTTDHVDISIESVTRYRLNTGLPETESAIDRSRREDQLLFPRFEEYNQAEGLRSRTERRPHLKDFYSETDAFASGASAQQAYDEKLASLAVGARAAIERENRAEAAGEGAYYTAVRFRNIGGVPTPLPLRLTFEDGSQEQVYVPAEVWRKSTGTVEKVFVRSKPVIEVAFDPYRETLDTDLTNNVFPQLIAEGYLKVTADPETHPNQMKDTLTEEAAGRP